MTGSKRAGALSVYIVAEMLQIWLLWGEQSQVRSSHSRPGSAPICELICDNAIMQTVENRYIGDPARADIG